jgi:hypothetical protein
MTTTTIARALHTVTFETKNGCQEIFHCRSWAEFHVMCQVMELRGFRVAAWVDRSK